MNKIRLLCFGTILAFLTALAVVPATNAHAAAASARAAASQPPASLKVATGQQFAATNASGATVGRAEVSGVTPAHFTTVNGKTVLQGTISGTLHANGKSVPFSQTISAPVQQVAVTCPVLSLVLGPLYLNLLGLHITINQVIVDVTAVQGGGLLGDLFCGLANLLGPGPASALLTALLGGPLTNLLNYILGIFFP